MKHLEDHEFMVAVEGGSLAPEAADHLATCISCRQQVAELQGAVATRRADLNAETPNWNRQLEEILSRLPSSPSTAHSVSRRWLRPLLAAAAVLLVTVGLSSLWERPGVPQPVAGGEIEIEEILAEVDAVLADESVPGFELIDPGLDDPESLFENGAS